MYREVVGYVALHTEVTDRLPGFGMHLSRLKAAIEGVTMYSRRQSEGWMGKADEKRRRREEMTEKALDMSRRLRAYAMAGDDLVLAAEMNLSKRKFVHMADTLVAGLAGRVLERAKTHATGIEPYGIGTAETTSLEGAIAAYVALVSVPRAAQAARKANREGLVIELRKGKEALEMMDMLMEIVKYEEVGFYGSYRSLRRVRDHSTRHLGMQGKVLDAATGKGLRSVSIELAREKGMLETKGEREVKRLIRKRELVVRKSQKKGGWWVKHLKEGEWHLRAILAGYKTLEMTVYVVKGEMTKVEVRMERVKL